MSELRRKRNYKALAFIPMIFFLVLYVGVGVFFTIQGVESPFNKIPRHVAVLIAIIIALLFYDRETTIDAKIEVFAKGAGSSGVILLGIIILLTGGFSSITEEIGGMNSMVNLGLKLISSNLLIPGIFIVTSVISTCIGTSMGTQVAMLPIAVAIAKGAGLNIAMAGSAVIAGSYFGDNLSMISDTTIVATKGVGADMKDKFKMNFFIALPAAIITIALYAVLSGGGSGKEISDLSYNALEVIPYFTVLITALMGLNVVLVLVIGIVLSCIIGMAMGTVSFFDCAAAIGTGMQGMFFLYVFASLVAGLIELIKYYGGMEWLIETLTSKIKGRKSCETIIGLTTLALSGTTLNNTVAIVITAPIAKALGEKYNIAPKRLASILDIFSCAILGLVPHDSSILLTQQYGGVTYLEILKCNFYPVLLLVATMITIQFGIMRTNEEKEAIIVQEVN